MQNSPRFKKATSYQLRQISESVKFIETRVLLRPKTFGELTNSIREFSFVVDQTKQISNIGYPIYLTVKANEMAELVKHRHENICHIGNSLETLVELGFGHKSHRFFWALYTGLLYDYYAYCTPTGLPNQNRKAVKDLVEIHVKSMQRNISYLVEIDEDDLNEGVTHNHEDDTLFGNSITRIFLNRINISNFSGREHFSITAICSQYSDSKKVYSSDTIFTGPVDTLVTKYMCNKVIFDASQGPISIQKHEELKQKVNDHVCNLSLNGSRYHHDAYTTILDNKEFLLITLEDISSKKGDLIINYHFIEN